MFFVNSFFVLDDPSVATGFFLITPFVSEKHGVKAMSALGRCIIFMLFFLYISLRVLLCFFFNLRRSSCAAARWCEWRGHRRVAGVENR